MDQTPTGSCNNCKYRPVPHSPTDRLPLIRRCARSWDQPGIGPSSQSSQYKIPRPARPLFRLFSSASSRWLPALSSLFALPTIAQRWPPLPSPRWLNLISPYSIRPLALWATGLFGDTSEKPNQCLASLFSFDVVAVPHGRH